MRVGVSNQSQQWIKDRLERETDRREQRLQCSNAYHYGDHLDMDVEGIYRRKTTEILISLATGIYANSLMCIYIVVLALSLSAWRVYIISSSHPTVHKRVYMKATWSKRKSSIDIRCIYMFICQFWLSALHVVCSSATHSVYLVKLISVELF